MSRTPGESNRRESGGSTQPLGVWWVGVVGLVVAGLLLTSSNLRAYGYALGATLAVLALLRAVLPTGRAGGLAVRSRVGDVITLLLLAGATVTVAATLRLG